MAFTVKNSIRSIKQQKISSSLSFGFSSYSNLQTISGYNVYTLNGGTNTTNSNYTITVTGGADIGNTPTSTKKVLFFIVGGGGGTLSGPVSNYAAGGGGAGRVIDTSLNIGHNQTINISVAGMSVFGSYGNDTSLNYIDVNSIQQTIVAGGGGYGRLNQVGLRPLTTNGGSASGGGSTQNGGKSGAVGYWGGNGGAGNQMTDGSPVAGGGGGAGDGTATGSGSSTVAGGAGIAGGNATNAGDGGIGRKPINATIFGTSYYAGGGGGGSRTAVVGGAGGGGDGGMNGKNPTNGAANTGGGGGGCYAGNYSNGTTQAGSQGGSGIIMIAIPI